MKETLFQSAADTSNFDKYPRDEAVPADELSGWDKEFWIYTRGENIYQWSDTQQLHPVPCLSAEVILFVERGMGIDITVQVKGVKQEKGMLLKEMFPGKKFSVSRVTDSVSEEMTSAAAAIYPPPIGQSSQIQALR